MVKINFESDRHFDANIEKQEYTPTGDFLQDEIHSYG